jgi:hypothetical protein
MKKYLLIALTIITISGYSQAFEEAYKTWHNGNFANYLGGRVATALRNQPTIVDFVHDYVMYNIYLLQNPDSAATYLTSINSRLGTSYDTLPRLGWGSGNPYPAGNTTEIQFNLNGLFGSDSDFKYDTDTLILEDGTLIRFHSVTIDSIAGTGNILITEAFLDAKGFVDTTYVLAAADLTSVDSIVFNSSVNSAYFNGKFQRDSTFRGDGLIFYNDNSEVGLNIGFENWIYVQNNTGNTISNGDVVRIIDASAEIPRITWASNALDSSSVIGMATEDILNGEQGYVTTVGIIDGLTTTGCTEGLPIYVGKNGTYTSSLVEYPLVNVRVGYCLREHASEGLVLISVEQLLNNHKENSVIFIDGNDEHSSDSANFNYTESEDSLYVNLANIDSLYSNTLIVSNISVGDLLSTTRISYRLQGLMQLIQWVWAVFIMMLPNGLH